MLYGLYISAAGLKVNEYQQAVHSNNLANVGTVGFKLDRVVVESRPAATDRQGSAGVQISLPGPGGGVWARRTVTEMAAGPLEATGQPLDVALDTGATADGFLCVRGPDGAQRWTRDGRLGLDPGGRLITQAAGLAVLGESGQAIRLDPQAGPVTIDRNGRIRQGNTEAASLRLATFGQPERLAKLGGGLFAAPADLAPTPFRGQVVQGHVEASAVEPTTMLARLIETQRAYEANANMIRFQDQTLNRAVNDIGRIG